MKTGLLVSLYLLGAVLRAADVPVQTETLGCWHYLHPFELASPNNPAPKYPRLMFVPTVLLFAQGKRIAAILPGSSMVAEFRDGRFIDLKWPALDLPLTLAADSDGTLCCLFRERLHVQDDDAAPPQWIAFLRPGARHWSAALPVPLPSGDISHADHIEFDSHHRLWALGPCGTVAVWVGGQWNTYAYSSDKHLHFAPVRLVEGPGDDITLFANWKGEAEVSHLTGTLVYHAGQFSHQAALDPSALRQAQQQKDQMQSTDNFDRSTGYVCHPPGPVNTNTDGPKTVLTTEAFSIVSLANDGFTWAQNSELKVAPVLSEDTEWERIEDVLIPPTTDPTGALWLGRDNPPRLIRITAAKTDEFPNPDFIGLQSTFVLFDQLNRPWILSGYGEEAGVTIFDHDFHAYGSLVDALRAHAGDFKAGNIFNHLSEMDRYGDGPGVLKTAQGQICLGGPQFEKFTILDGDQTTEFEPSEIDPAQAQTDGGHGYNPFSNGEPRLTADGDVTTCVDDMVYRYHSGQWIQVGNYSDPGAGQPRSDYATDDPLDTQFSSEDGRMFVFHGFHFYEKTSHGLVQLDFGLNPLAYYPFWKGWWVSPGMTQPRVDPTGRLWISSVGPSSRNQGDHREDSIWQVLRKPVPSGK